jgi:hypothetical protein
MMIFLMTHSILLTSFETAAQYYRKVSRGKLVIKYSLYGTGLMANLLLYLKAFPNILGWKKER